MTKDEFVDRLAKLSEAMGDYVYTSDEWNNPTPEYMVENNTFIAGSVTCALTSKNVPRAQAMKIANELWRKVQRGDDSGRNY